MMDTLISAEPDAGKAILPLYIVVIADWYDISPGIKDYRVKEVIAAEDSKQTNEVLKHLMKHKKEYDLHVDTQEEHDPYLIGIISEDENKPVRVFHHYAAAFIRTESLKQSVKAVIAQYSDDEDDELSG